MMAPARFLRLIAIAPVFAIGAAAMSGCSTSSTTSPTGTGSTVSITSVSPAQPEASSVVQILDINGSGFASGLSLRVTDPSGGVVLVQGSDLQNVVSASFNAAVVLATPGVYRLSVLDPSGVSSDPFLLTVATQGTSGAPSIASITPTATTRSVQTQVVSILGLNFDTTVTVNISDPQGFTTRVDATQATTLTSTFIQFPFVFSKSGNYLVNVSAASGPLSNTVLIAVQ